MFRILSILCGLSSMVIYYITNMNQELSWSLTAWSLEQKSKWGLEVWLMLLFPTIFFSILASRKAKTTYAHQTVNPPMPRDYATKERHVFQAKPMSSTPITTFSGVEELLQQGQQLPWPVGVSLVMQPMEHVPFGLELRRCTPENTRRSFEVLGTFIAQIPTPPRIHIKFIDIMPTGAAPKNIAKGGLGKTIDQRKFVISEQIDGLDIRFHEFDDYWK